MNMHRSTCAKFGPDRFSCLASFAHVFNLDPLLPFKCPSVLEGLFVLAYVNSQLNLYTRATFGIDCSSGLEAFPDLGIDDPLTSPCPSGIKGVFFLAKFGPNRFVFGIFPTFVNV